MKKYIIRRGNFGNTYALCYIDAKQAIPEGWEQITRAEAIRLCHEEKEREKYDQAFSGYASSYVAPYGYPEDYDIKNDSRYKLVNYIYEKIK